MKVHIVGAGPTGMSLAWEILRSGDHEITIYDRKTSAGGSWWEPTEEIRDLHAHRIVFDKAFVNTQSLFNEMGINWDDIFEPAKKVPPTVRLTVVVTKRLWNSNIFSCDVYLLNPKV